jgi:hypothetical protein
MSDLTEGKKIAKALKRDHNATIARLEAARDSLEIGTQSYLHYETAIADERRKHTKQLTEFGIIPKDLKTAAQTRFMYVSFLPVIPSNQKELDELLKVQMVEAVKDLDYSPESEAWRAQMAEDFKSDKPSNEATSIQTAHPNGVQRVERA